MGELISFPSALRRSRDILPAQNRAPETVFQDRGWRILRLPSVGRFLAVSAYCRRGIEVGRFDPTADTHDRHCGTEIAILTRCAADERLARCTIGWLNSGGPQTAILSPFVVVTAGRYRYWRDAIVEVAAICGTRLVRLIDGSIAVGREPEPLPLLDLFAPLKENRRRPAFDRLPRDTRAAILWWADPCGQFGELIDAMR